MKEHYKVLLLPLICFFLIITYAKQGFIFQKCIAVGDSMQPAIKDGSCVWICKIVRGNLTGQIVALQPKVFISQGGAQYILHRVIQDRGDYVITKGDNLPKTDPWKLGKDRIIGVVVLILPLWGRYLDQALVLVVFMVCAIMLWRLEE